MALQHTLRSGPLHEIVTSETDHNIAILPFLRCFGAKIPDAQALRAAFHILRHPRIQRQAVRFYSPPFAVSKREAASAIEQRLPSPARTTPQSTHAQ